MIFLLQFIFNCLKMKWTIRIFFILIFVNVNFACTSQNNKVIKKKTAVLGDNCKIVINEINADDPEKPEKNEFVELKVSNII